MLAPQHRKNRKVLILGSGRCGTSSLALNLQALGLDVQDERMGADGTAGLWFATRDAAWYPYWPWDPTRCYPDCRRSDFYFNVTLHVVRDPRHVIPAMGKVFPSLVYEWLEDHEIIPQRKPRWSQLARCAFAWLKLNQLAEAQADYRFQIEQVNTPYVQARLRNLLGLPSAKQVPWPNIVARDKHTGYRAYTPLTWRTLRSELPHIAPSIMHLASRYGYQI